MEPEISHHVTLKEILFTHSKIRKILLGICVIVIILGIASWTMLLLEPKQVSQNVVVSTDETEDWKTYRNEEYGFEFKYPKDWEERHGDSNKVVGFGTNNRPLDYPLELQVFLEKSFNDLRMRYEIKENDVVSYMKAQPYPNFTKEINSISWFCQDTAGDGPGDILSCVFENGNKNLVFMSFSTTHSIVDQILSTFKFTK